METTDKRKKSKNLNNKKKKEKKKNKPVKIFKTHSLILAFATQTPDDELFRRLLDNINELDKCNYNRETFNSILNLSNDILGLNDLSLEYNDNLSLIKNSRGMIIKVLNKNGKLFIDSYFSYASVRSIGNKKIKLGDLLFNSLFKKIYNITSSLTVFKTTPEILRNILKYAILNNLIDHNLVLAEIINDNIPVELEEKLSYTITTKKKDIKFSEYFKYMTDHTVLALIGQISIIQDVLKIKKEEKKNEFNLNLSQIFIVFISMVAGFNIVQAALMLLSQSLQLNYITLFASITIGIILNNTVGEFALKHLVKDYAERLKLGESSNGTTVFIWATFFNLLLHIILILVTGVYLFNIFTILISFLFFIYPSNYLMGIMWSIKKEVLKINSGKEKINRRNYANIPNTSVKIHDYLPVTISIPIYLEANPVIFETLNQSIAAINYFQDNAGKAANILISDDGLQKMLDNKCNADRINELIKLKNENTENLTSLELQAIERIEFFRKNNIAFVARPTEGRVGRFKKGSNLNYSLKLADRIKEGESLNNLIDVDGDFAGGYAEGDIIINDIILLLDKDSGLEPSVLFATVPEFVVDPKLAYTQHCTRSANTSDNYFTKAMGQFTTTLFSNSLPNKALQGFLVPLVGHNAFLRKSFLENSGYWAEDRVSEDLAKALDVYRFGYHGKYIAYEGLDFTEYVSRTFTEETGKQLRYSFGIVEILFNSTSNWLKQGLFNDLYKRQIKMYPKSRFYDIFDIPIYFCSFINSAILIPATLISAYTRTANHIWGGFLSNIVIFCIFPIVAKSALSGKEHKNFIDSTRNAFVLAFAFLGHSYSILKGFVKFFTDSFKSSPKPFSATSVDSLDYSSMDGIKIIYQYYKNNKIFLLVSLLFIERAINLLIYPDNFIMTMITMTYILTMFPIVLPLLTPPLFAGPKFLKKLSKKSNMVMVKSEENVNVM